MGKKSKKHTKPKDMTQDLATAIIDFNIGPWLIILGMREPESASELSDILTKFCLSKSKEEQYAENPDRMISDLSAGVAQLYNTYMGAKLLKYYKDGIPSRLIIPGTLPPMGGTPLGPVRK